MLEKRLRSLPVSAPMLRAFSTTSLPAALGHQTGYPLKGAAVGERTWVSRARSGMGDLVGDWGRQARSWSKAG